MTPDPLLEHLHAIHDAALRGATAADFEPIARRAREAGLSEASIRGTVKAAQASQRRAVLDHHVRATKVSLGRELAACRSRLEPAGLTLEQINEVVAVAIREIACDAE